MTATPRRGRRPGAPDTRAAILESARESFGQKGFAGTSVRAVASRAGVDAALVHHYFGTKDDLFLSAMELPVDIRAVVARVAAGGVEGAAERLLTVFLEVWDDPELTPVFVGRMRQLLEPGGERLLGQGLVPVVFGPAGVALGIDAPEQRMPLVVSQMLGLILTRYVLGVEPIASMPADLVVATYAPTIQRYLTGDLPA
ncbi:MAG: TetR family transcriptional regulator [Nocardioides sp.]